MGQRTMYRKNRASRSVIKLNYGTATIMVLDTAAYDKIRRQSYRTVVDITDT